MPEYEGTIAQFGKIYISQKAYLETADSLLFAWWQRIGTRAGREECGYVPPLVGLHLQACGWPPLVVYSTAPEVREPLRASPLSVLPSLVRYAPAGRSFKRR